MGKFLLYNIFYCFIILLSPFVSVAQLNFSSNNALQNLHVTSIAQDDLGYIWFGTAKGACRFNGYEYTHFYHDVEDSTSISSDGIHTILCGSDGCTWIGTGNGINKFDPRSKNFFRYGPKQGIPPGYVTQIFERDSSIYTLMGHRTIFRKPHHSDQFELCFSADLSIETILPENDLVWTGLNRYWKQSTLIALDSLFRPVAPPIDLNADQIFCIYIHTDGDLWIGTSQGVRIFSKKDKERYLQQDSPVIPVPEPRFEELAVTAITRFNSEMIVLGTSNAGLYFYNTLSGQLLSSSETYFFPNLKSKHILTYFHDRNNNFWVGTFDQGYCFENLNKRKFNQDYFLNQYLHNKFVSRIAEDPKGNLLIGTRLYGLLHYDRHKKTISSYTNQNSPFFANSNTNFVQEVFLDSRRRVWIGSENLLTVCRLTNGVLQPIKSFPYRIVTITEDPFHRIWVGTARNGMYIIDKLDQEPKNILLPNISNNITKILPLNQEEMIFSSYSFGIYKINISSWDVKKIELQEGQSLPFKSIINMTRNSDGKIWIGTYGEGLGFYDPENKLCKAYSLNDGLPSNDILGIVDIGNEVWISTSFGLSRFSKATGIFLNFYDYDGIGGNQFHEKSCFSSPDGTIYFGGNHGITSFHPKEIVIPHASVPIVLENLRIFNQIVSPNDSHQILHQALCYTDTIVLSHKQNAFSIDYAGIDFNLAQKINYAYKLENFDKEWNYVNQYRRASYSNLKAGNYIFKVKAQNHDGTWDNDNPTQLFIKVKYSPWETPLMIFAYIVIIATILIAFLRLYINFKISNERLVISELEKQQEKEMTQMKMNFFSNISHELRIPLTLIYGCVSLLDSPSSKPEERPNLIRSINYNIERLLRLLNQALDYSRMERDTLPLMVSNNDLAPVIQNIINSYRYYARIKHIELTLHLDSERIPICADLEKIDKIINNLLSNALKYTLENGHITVQVEQLQILPKEFQAAIPNAAKYLYIRVEDDGIGMDPEDIKQIFDRFSRFDKHGISKTGGFGIGLHYVKRLIETHKGDILAEPNQPKGMIFSFVIPTDPQSYDEREKQTSSPEYFSTMLDPTDPEPEEYVHPDKDLPRILVAEDNAEVRNLIAQIFRENFHVILCQDGQQAWEKLIENDVELVISDVLMPRMNGFELCRKVKNKQELCHISFVLLTAKTNYQDHVEGYSCGADMYLEKPFHPELLQTIVRNHGKRKHLYFKRV